MGDYPSYCMFDLFEVEDKYIDCLNFSYELNIFKYYV